DLPGLRTFVRLIVVEVERRRELAARVHELHAVLLDEAAPLHLLQHADPFQDPVGFRNQRFANVKARKALPLEETDAKATLGYQCRNRRSGRAAAYHYHVKFGLHLYLGSTRSCWVPPGSARFARGSARFSDSRGSRGSEPRTNLVEPRTNLVEPCRTQ